MHFDSIDCVRWRTQQRRSITASLFLFFPGNELSPISQAPSWAATPRSGPSSPYPPFFFLSTSYPSLPSALHVSFSQWLYSSIGISKDDPKQHSESRQSCLSNPIADLPVTTRTDSLPPPTASHYPLQGLTSHRISQLLALERIAVREASSNLPCSYHADTTNPKRCDTKLPTYLPY